MTGKQSVLGLAYEPVCNRLTLNLVLLPSCLLISLKVGSPRTPFWPSFGCPLVHFCMWHVRDCLLWSQDKHIHPARHRQTTRCTFADFCLVNSRDQFAASILLLGVVWVFSKVSGYLSISDPVWIHSGALGHPTTPVRHVAMKGKLTTHFE